MTNKIFSLFLVGLVLNLGACKKEEVTPNQNSSAANTYLALGDSYTIGESVAVKQRFPVQLANELRNEGYDLASPHIIARTGWTTGNLLSVLNNENLPTNYDLVTLLIGVNNQYQGRSLSEYRTEFTTLLNRAVAYAGGEKDKVIVVSIPDWGYTPFGRSQQAQISPKIDQFNAANKEITQAAGISYAHITPISRRGLQEPNLVASDGLHPSGTQYAEWVKLILPQAVEAIKQ